MLDVLLDSLLKFSALAEIAPDQNNQMVGHLKALLTTGAVVIFTSIALVCRYLEMQKNASYLPSALAEAGSLLPKV